MKPPRKPKQPGSSPQPTGTESFGSHPKGLPTGAAAFGEGDAANPLRGALLFGNDPQGAPRGSESFGGSDARMPLRGALLFGNDPQGTPRGSEAFGGPDAGMPLRGALLFGNDPQGTPRGSEAFGNDPQLQTGSMAFGATQLVPDRLHRDDISYDFAGVLLALDTEGLAGIRKDPRDRLRERVLSVLARRLQVDPQKVRHGLGEHAIPWGRMKRDSSMDKKLAELLQDWWKVAPGNKLGVAQVLDVLESSDRMHNFELRCEWDARPIRMTVLPTGKVGEPLAYAEAALHKEHQFFILRTPEKMVFAYVDIVSPRRNAQTARIRDADGTVVGQFELTTPAVADAVEGKRAQLKGVLRDAKGRVAFRLVEERASSKSFLANLLMPDSDDKVGRIEDRLSGGRIRTTIEVDVGIPRLLVWAIASIMADLARLRREGWPDKPSDPEPDAVETIEQALGPRRRRST